MNKITCERCAKDYVINDKHIKAYDDFSPVINWKKYTIVPPSICPDCSEQIRLSFRNKRNLYRRKCDFSWKDILSLYSPDKEVKVFDKDIWWSDKWSALDYWQVFDEDNTFFEQLKDLIWKVPYPNLTIVNSENCEYNDSLVWSKNSYMCFWNNNLEDTYYTEESRNIKTSSDIWWSWDVEKSYEIIDSANIYNSKYCFCCDNSSNITLCSKCSNCHDCFMCYWLDNKRYHILNKEYSKEEYIKKMQEIDLWDYEKVKTYTKIYNDFVIKMPHQHLQMNNSENSMWDYLYFSKEANNCFNIIWVQNAINLYEWWRCSMVYDSSFVYDLEWPVIWSIIVFNASKNIYFSEYIYDNSFNIFYSVNLKACKNCFACVWLVGKEFCIFNKQYTQQWYYDEVERIINVMDTPPKSPSTEEESWAIAKQGQWGSPLPPCLSRFWYNETESNFYYPVESHHPSPFPKGEGIEKWEIKNNTFIPIIPLPLGEVRWGLVFNRSTYEAPFPKVDKIIPANKLPDNIKDIPDDILNRAIECEVTKKPFRIISQELEFYRKHNLPIPRRHPDQRHLDRMALRNPRKLFDRKCDKCGKDMKTTYAPDRSEIVYCEECYNREIY